MTVDDFSDLLTRELARAGDHPEGNVLAGLRTLHRIAVTDPHQVHAALSECRMSFGSEACFHLGSLLLAVQRDDGGVLRDSLALALAGEDMEPLLEEVDAWRHEIGRGSRTPSLLGPVSLLDQQMRADRRDLLRILRASKEIAIERARHHASKILESTSSVRTYVEQLSSDEQRQLWLGTEAFVELMDGRSGDQTRVVDLEAVVELVREVADELG